MNVRRFRRQEIMTASASDNYHAVSSTEVFDRYDSVQAHGEFRWNSRICKGNELHKSALSGDFAAATAAIEEKGIAIDARFSYETVWEGKPQEGGGDAIHLAASRGHVEVVQLLLAKKASLSASVSRNNKPHYDVLHAAMFAEGRGGSPEMIEYLFAAKAEMTMNQDKKHPLHIAFQTGNVPAINLVRKYMIVMGMTDEHYRHPDVPLPLELGIRNGNMSEQELSDAAEPSAQSLKMFIDECPQCIPSFLKRMDQANQVSVNSANLLRSLTRLDIARVLGESPEAAIALLNHATDEPVCQNSGWHPLPTRVSFAPRNILERLREFINPPPTYLTFYEEDHVWRYDSQQFKSPEWHTTLTDRRYGRPILDAEVRVCHVPDLLCPEVFAALCDPVNADSLPLYENDTITASVQHLFWNGTCRIDLTWAVLTFWGLAILIFEEFYVRRFYSSSYGRSLDSQVMPNDSTDLIPGVAGGNILQLLDEGPPQTAWVSIAWVASMGLSDIFMEFTKLLGFKAIGRTRSYFSLANFAGLVASGLPSLLFIDKENRVILVCTVLMYWFRMLGSFTSMQYVSMELLPITHLLRGLGPSLFASGVFFMAFSHAFYLARGSIQPMWPTVLFDSFATLITYAMPERVDSTSQTELVLVLISVIVFSFFILNIFIGVMCELYIAGKDTADTMFKSKRASFCLFYLLRCRILPCSLCSERAAYCLIPLPAIAAIGCQVFCFMYHSQRYVGRSSLCFLICQLLIILFAFQRPDAPWIANISGKHQDHYIWFCKRKTPEAEDPKNVPVKRILSKMTSVCDEIKALDAS